MRKKGRALLFTLLLVALGFGIVVWRNPLWLVDRQVDARLRLHGVHSEFTTVNGYKMHYLVGGSGRPLVLVHGLGSRALDWANLMPQLIDGGHRVYALDLLGYGQSAQPKSGDYSIADQASMVQGFLDSQHLQQVDLAGWSMGGWIAMRVALQHPERIRRLVLLDSAGLRFKLGFDPSLFQPASRKDLAALEELLVPHPRPLPGFLAMAMLRRGDHIGWVVHRSVQSHDDRARLGGWKAGRLNHARADWLGRAGSADPACGRLQTPPGDIAVRARCVCRLRPSCAWTMCRSSGTKCGGLSECATGPYGDGSAHPGARRSMIGTLPNICVWLG